MSMHKKPLTQIEEDGLRTHGLTTGSPSQLSDVFRHGMAWAQLAASKTDRGVAESRGEDLQLELESAEGRYANCARNSSAFENRMGELQSENGKLKDRIAELVGQCNEIYALKDKPSVVALPDDDELSELSSSACQAALSFGIGEDSFLRLARAVRSRCAKLNAGAVAGPGGWTSCEVRMPEPEVEVLIVVNGVRRVGVLLWAYPGFGDNFAAHTYWDDPEEDGHVWEHGDVTCWQPLDAVPEPAAEPVDDECVHCFVMFQLTCVKCGEPY